MTKISVCGLGKLPSQTAWVSTIQSTGEDQAHGYIKRDIRRACVCLNVTNIYEIIEKPMFFHRLFIDPLINL